MLALIPSLKENQYFSLIMMLFNFANILLILHDSFHNTFKKSFISLILTHLSCSFHLFILLISLWCCTGTARGSTSLSLCRVHANKNTITILIWSFFQSSNKFGDNMQTFRSFNYSSLSRDMSYSHCERASESSPFLPD